MVQEASDKPLSIYLNGQIDNQEHLSDQETKFWSLRSKRRFPSLEMTYTNLLWKPHFLFICYNIQHTHTHTL